MRRACGRVVRKVLSKQLLMPRRAESLPSAAAPPGKKTPRAEAFDAQASVFWVSVPAAFGRRNSEHTGSAANGRWRRSLIQRGSAVSSPRTPSTPSPSYPAWAGDDIKTAAGFVARLLCKEHRGVTDGAGFGGGGEYATS